MSNKTKNIEIANDTLKILEQGYYVNNNNENIQLTETIKTAKNNTRLYTPAILDSELSNTVTGLYNEKATITVTNETTLSAIQKLVDKVETSVACLNFASAKNPGGGFLTGASTQEESLVRSSALYPCISQVDTFYLQNRKCGTCLYTGNIIFSPKVPFIKNDNGNLLDTPNLISIITAPAVNRKVVLERESKENIVLIDLAMKDRIRMILKIAQLNGCDSIVLGAFGCGVFGNDSFKVASIFKELLHKEEFIHAFKDISFAVLDTTKDLNTFKTFQHVLR